MGSLERHGALSFGQLIERVGLDNASRHKEKEKEAEEEEEEEEVNLYHYNNNGILLNIIGSELRYSYIINKRIDNTGKHLQQK